MKTDELKPCPFCGGEARLRRVTTSYRANPTTIMDEWKVECSKGCCSSPKFKDCIYHKDDGEIIVESNGSKNALEFWNKRGLECPPT